MKDLSNYSISQLRELEAQVTEELRTRHFLNISKAREQILHIARNVGLSDEDIVSIRAPKSQQQRMAAIKYQNPANPSQQWSGRGRQPAWVKAWIASGKPIDETRINAT